MQEELREIEKHLNPLNNREVALQKLAAAGLSEAELDALKLPKKEEAVKAE